MDVEKGRLVGMGDDDDRATDAMGASLLVREIRDVGDRVTVRARC